MKMSMVNQDNIQIASEVIEADTMLRKMKGLMFAEGMDGYDGLLFTRAPSIHTFFMKFPIDVLFLNKNKKIIKIIRNLKPWRLTRTYFTAYQTLELMGGALDERVKEGDVIEVVCTN